MPRLLFLAVKDPEFLSMRVEHSLPESVENIEVRLSSYLSGETEP